MLGVVTPYSLMFIGVAAAVLPLAPFPGAKYVREWLRGRLPLAVLWYLLAIAGCVIAAVAFSTRQPQWMWGIGIALALSWWFIATGNGKAQKQEAAAAAEGGKADA